MVRIFNIQQPDSSSRIINASISIHRPLKAPLPEGISFKQKPWQKNLLVASFQGSFADYPHALFALEQYAVDYGLINMAIPYVAIPKELKISSDTQQVELNVYYPYF